MAADPGTGAQRAVGTVRRQAALPPTKGTACSFPLDCACGQPGRGWPALLISQQEDNWKYRVLVNPLKVWTPVQDLVKTLSKACQQVESGPGWPPL